MSKLLVSQYHAEVEKIVQYGGSKKETSIRNAFEKLLNEYCKPRDFLLIPELEYKTLTGKVVYPDGTVKDALRLDWGYWESKDQYDSIDREIEKKFAKGYPNDNILFEDSQTAILIQAGQENARISMRDADALDGILNVFTNYVRPEVKDFREAIKIFKQDLPTVLDTLRQMLQVQEAANSKFRDRRNQFLQICRDSINPEISLFDVQEMIIQHILTEDIFINIFSESQFHRENNIARELHEIVQTFFTGATKKNTLGTIDRYYAVIRRTAANIYNHHEKQKFLKAVYENFYKAYNPKAADRLGIVYTPNEIVRFMIESADYLTHKHFGKLLADPGVEILDPATGTGTFVTELIEYLPKSKLEHKYKHEIHCNEVAILPYYIANLNIEFTYQQKMGKYEEFANICLMDTLEHTTFDRKQGDLFALSTENTERIKRQNERDVKLIIGNPPYNAKQENYNDNNANRAYPAIDRRIKDTYIKHGTAQNQIVLYDMYVRFLRWASDRLGRNGIVAFVSNSSFIDSRAFDGFRKVVAEEFNEIHIIDLKGNARNSGERRRQEGGNVFSDEIKVGVAVYFLIRSEKLEGFKVFYNSIRDYAKAEEKKEYVSNKFRDLDFSHAKPDANFNWINLSDNDFDRLVPLIAKDVKDGRSEQAIFKLFSRGVATQRDEWVYDFSKAELENRMKFFVDVYERKRRTNEELNFDIKWDAELDRYLERDINKKFEDSNILHSVYRPFSKMYFYFDKHFNGRTYQWPGMLNLKDFDNKYISFASPGCSKPFHCLSSNLIVDLHLTGDSQCFSLYRYVKGDRIDNITDWGLQQFQAHYGDRAITKLDIFHYTYAVLHHPAYRQKYEQNLKREFPRLPFYENFSQWANWGKQLMNLHIEYESVEPFGLDRIEIKTTKFGTPKPRLKADKLKGTIYIDEETQLEGVPAIAWEYKLGNRSALEWILDQYKEKKPKDPTIAAKFNNYRFADYKEQAIDLLQRVCTVSVETMKLIRSMP